MGGYFFTGVFILVIVGYKYSAEIKGTVYRSDVASEVKKMSQSESKTWKTSEFKSLPVEAKQDLDKVTVKEADLPIKLDGKVWQFFASLWERLSSGFSSLFLISFPIHIDTISTGLPIVYFIFVCLFVCLFDLILYVPSTIFQLNRDRSSWVEPVLS